MQPTYPPPPQQPMYYPPQPPKSSTSTVLIVLLCVGGGIVVIGILAAIAIPSFLQYQKKAKKSEATLNLQRLTMGVKQAYAMNGVLPEQSSDLTPASSCCESPDRKCPVDMSQWMAEPWTTLDFEIDEPSLFQYSYEVSGDSFTLRAVSDLDCDGVSSTYTVTGTVRGGGIETTMVEPDHPD